MFKWFTERAHRVIVLAVEEAKRLNHNVVGTEHILLGIIREGEGAAINVLESLNISPERVRRDIEIAIDWGERTPQEGVAFTPQAKKVLELALDEARRLGHGFIGAKHLLLGLIREGEGVTARVLKTMGAGLEQLERALASRPPSRKRKDRMREDGRGSRQTSTRFGASRSAHMPNPDVA